MGRLPCLALQLTALSHTTIFLLFPRRRRRWRAQVVLQRQTALRTYALAPTCSITLRPRPVLIPRLCHRRQTAPHWTHMQTLISTHSRHFLLSLLLYSSHPIPDLRTRIQSPHLAMTCLDTRMTQVSSSLPSRSPLPYRSRQPMARL